MSLSSESYQKGDELFDTGETVYDFCDLTDNSTDENEPNKTVEIEQPEGI